MALLGTSRRVVFDRRYPSEYRFASYFARLAERMTEPFDPERHLGVTPFFFGDQPAWGPIPFATDVLHVGDLRRPLLRSMWQAWSEVATDAAPDARWYAEKLAVPVEDLRDAGLRVSTIDLVRDPRDVLASIRAFTARGIDGFGRTPGIDEGDYLEAFVERTRARLDGLDGIDGIDAERDGDRVVLRYEDLVGDLPAVAARLGAWLDVDLDAVAVLDEDDLAHHRTSASPASSIGRWRDDLAPAEADRIVEVLGPTLARLGYEA